MSEVKNLRKILVTSLDPRYMCPSPIEGGPPRLCLLTPETIKRLIEELDNR